MSIRRLADELAGLREELGALAREQIAAATSVSRETIDGATKALGETLQDLEEILAREEESLEGAISSRPLASVAAAFVAGLAVGLILGRR